MGTPRQPQLVPASRGWIDIEPSLQPSLLDGIQHYSHGKLRDRLFHRMLS